MSHPLPPSLNTAYGTQQFTPDQNWFTQSALGRSGMSAAVEGTDGQRVHHVTLLHRHDGGRTTDLIEMEAGCTGDYLAPNCSYHDVTPAKGWHKA